MSHLYREGAATLNDMKDMLASLPQYQEQREKVRRQSAHRPSIASITNTDHLTVFITFEYGTRVHGHFRARQVTCSGDGRAGTSVKCGVYTRPFFIVPLLGLFNGGDCAR